MTETLAATGSAEIGGEPARAAQAMTTTPKGIDLGDKGEPTQKADAAKGKGQSTPPQNAPPAPSESFDVTIDGKVVKMTKEELIKAASLSKAAHSRFEESARMKKDAEAKLSRLKNPRDAIKLINELGLNPQETREAFEEWYKESFIDPELMTEEEKAQTAIQKELAQLKREKEERLAKDKAEEDAKLDNVTKETLQKELTEILDTSGLPKTKFTASRIAYWIRVNELKGINAPKELIIQQVQKETGDIVGALAKSVGDGGKLVEILGEDIVKRIRKYDLEQIRARRNGVTSPASEEPQTQEKKPQNTSGRITISEVRRRAREFR